MLAAWFIGRWEHGLDHDDQGRTFLDFDPDLFKPILSFLRSCAICSNPNARPMLVGVDASKQQAFADLVTYLALEDFIGYGQDTGLQPLKPRFARASVTATLSADRQTATVTEDTRRTWPIILVEPSCCSCCFLKFKINRWCCQPIFVGIGANLDFGEEAAFFGQETTHGWMTGHLPNTFRAQSFTKGAMGPQISHEVFRCNSWVLLKADFIQQKLFMRTSESSRSFDIPLMVADDLRSLCTFTIALNSIGDEVELLPVTPEDQSLFA